MEPEKVRTALDRFYAGESSAAEEALLKKFFAREDVPPEFTAEKEHFRMLRQWQRERLSDDFDTRLMEKISAPAKPQRTFSGWYLLAGVAASVMLVLALWLGSRQDRRSALPGTTQNPTVAYAQVRTALQMVSGTLNEGMQPARRAAGEFSGAMQQVSELGTLHTAMKPVEKLSEIERAQQLMHTFHSVYINFQPLKKNK